MNESFILVEYTVLHTYEEYNHILLFWKLCPDVQSVFNMKRLSSIKTSFENNLKTFISYTFLTLNSLINQIL